MVARLRVRVSRSPVGLAKPVTSHDVLCWFQRDAPLLLFLSLLSTLPSEPPRLLVFWPCAGDSFVIICAREVLSRVAAVFELNGLDDRIK